MQFSRFLLASLLSSAIAIVACADDRTTPPIKTDSDGTTNNADDPNSDSNDEKNNTSNDGTSNDTEPNNGTPNDDTANNDTPNNPSNNTTSNNAGPDDLPNGEICPYDDPGDFVGQCDPVRLTGCSAPQACLTGVQIVGNETTLSAFCQEETDRHVLQEGEACLDTGDKCEPGTHCVDFKGVCMRLCFAEDSLGCEPGEWCRRPARTWPGLGFCDEDCNL